MTPGGDVLQALVGTLENIQRLLPPDKSAWDKDDVVRLAIERLWITAGNLAERYRLDHGVNTGVEPWAELAGYRNLLAHALPGDISADRVYVDSTTDVIRILEQVRSITA